MEVYIALLVLCKCTVVVSGARYEFVSRGGALGICEMHYPVSDTHLPRMSNPVQPKRQEVFNFSLRP